MEGSKKWSTTALYYGTNNVFDFVDDKTEGVHSYVSLFADDAKLLGKILLPF